MERTIPFDTSYFQRVRGSLASSSKAYCACVGACRLLAAGIIAVTNCQIPSDRITALLIALRNVFIKSNFANRENKMAIASIKYRIKTPQKGE